MKVTLIFFLFGLIVNLDLVPGEKNINGEPQLDLITGTIKGKSVDFRGSKIYQFLNIPFAEPPINDLRFKKPIPKKPWRGVIDTNQWGSYCIQNLYPGFNIKFDEDCLVLNVFVTQSAIRDKQQDDNRRLRPVLVWFHGGGFNFGSANVPEFYDGTVLAALHDVIVVTVNYRLGPLGFLYLPESDIPGNMGLWDQRLALQWVKDNINSFGGDSDSVTIFGESAGSMSVSAHIVSLQSRGLFKNAIMQSASIYDLDRWTIKDLNTKFFKAIGCQPGVNISSCLLTFKNFGKSLINYYSDRYLANVDPNDSDNIRLAVSQALGDTILTCPTYAFGRDLVNSGSTNVYAYYQSQRPSQSLLPMATPSKWLPASHGDCIPMVFGLPLLRPENYTIDDTILSMIMMDAWVTFAREGKPPPIGQQLWSPWNNDSHKTITFDANKIGQTESQPIEFCLKHWPFPLESQYPLTFEPGKTITISKVIVLTFQLIYFLILFNRSIFQDRRSRT
ncbi:LOW QUALITY PROTEIN: acetylcholinesterase-like [Panonychus citri]|uniref:LOW QUALITY PROTEIN: acetylcholinesterase-like n=1 Tax=Panonychus citri TaxID=50023 RepID=UPI0023081DA7|nr:LOW QUALITY PROTEIN: acetylcholinesterase-like [Panonychus citri]